jgi:SPP1 family holin
MNKIKDILQNITKVSLGTWIRLALLVLSMVNIALRVAGVDTIPFVSEDVAEIITLIFAICTGLVAYWKNNSFTEAAQEADLVLHGEATICKTE